MRAENCDRYGAEIRGERMTYAHITRRYVCDKCGGALGHTFLGGVDKVACMRCGGEEIISETRYLQRISKGLEAEYVERDFIRRTGMALVDVVKGQKRKGRGERLGIVRLGVQVPNRSGNGTHGEATDYFVLRDAPRLAELFGEKPTSLPIKFPDPKFDDNILASYMVWAGGRQRGSEICLCEGNGEAVQSALPFTATVQTLDGGEERTSVRRAKGDRRVSWGQAAIDFKWDDHVFETGCIVPCPGSRDFIPADQTPNGQRWARYTHCGACSTSILIKVQVRHPAIASYGYWQITTGSINNYLHFMSQWNKITKDGLLDIPMSMVPFILSIRPGGALFQSEDKSWGKREAYYLNLAVDPDAVPLLQEYQDRRFLELMRGMQPDTLRLEATVQEQGGLNWEEELPFDDPPIEDGVFEPVNEEPEPTPEPRETIPPPKNLAHNNLAKLAVVLGGYDNQGQVKVAMLALYGPQWERSTEWSPTEAWHLLQDHAQAGQE